MGGTMTDTPETDHIEKNLGNAAHPILSSFCRRLERERDEGRGQLALTEKNLEISMQQTKQAVQDRADEHVVLIRQRDEARGQRDRLAEALRMITTFDYTDLQCDNGHGARSVATEALQSLNQTNE